MFSIPRVNVIESDEGFSVEVLGRTGLRYREGEKVMHIESEVLAGPSALEVDSSSIRNWEAPYSHEMVDETAKSRIVENIRAAFRFRGLEINIL
jgi:hypothetical protein